MCGLCACSSLAHAYSGAYVASAERAELVYVWRSAIKTFCVLAHSASCSFFECIIVGHVRRETAKNAYSQHC